MDGILKKIFEYQYEDREAIVTSDGESISFRSLYQSCVALALELENRNCSKNIILYTGNTIEYAIGLLAIWITDRTAVLADVRTGKKEIDAFLNCFESDTIIGSSMQVIEEINRNYIIPQKTKNDNSLKNKKITNELAIIFPTSGTTENPKYVQLTHKGIIAECEALKAAHAFDMNTRELIVVPITSSCGTLGQLIPVLYSGGSLSIYKGDLNIARLYRTIRETKPNIIVCTSSILSLLVKGKDSVYSDFESVKIIISAGESSNISLFDIAKKKFDLDNIIQCYGLTETSSALAGFSVDKEAPFESVGRILPNFKVRIKMEEEVLPPNKLGEIQVMGDSVTIGYYNDEYLTERSFDEGWLKTGDIGCLDEHGYLYIKGRIKNIIVVSGKNVYAEEVESILTQNILIASAYVYGKKSNVTGEKVVAEVVLKEKGTIEVDGIREFCNRNMVSYMVPRDIYIVEKQKINEAGKVSRK
ncbi:MAG: class I adenylate-forming enzyme family protein [Lachnospiraceae bacterium]|nr:class I adenylate-forming enzyme family protein [Lachnospiraceae bacterium]